MLCLALVEECGLVFFELAAGLACSSWHTITALWCFGLESNQRLCGVHCLFIITGIRFKEVGSHGRFGIRPRYLCYPLCSAAELPKLNMKKWSNHFLAEPFYEHTTV